MVQGPVHALGDLTQIVGRNVGGHTHRNTGRTVDQEVGEAGGQNGRFLCLAVIVGDEIDRVLVDIADHLHGQGRHAALRVPHGGGRIVAGGAEVALSVDQGVTHGPGLGQSHNRVVDGRVTVGVVLTHHVAYNAGALVVSPVGAVTAVVHGVDDPPVHRLHAITDIGECTLHNHGEGVGEVGLSHLLLQVNGLNPLTLEKTIIGVVHLLGAQRFARPVGQVDALLVRTIAVVVVVCQNRSLTQMVNRGGVLLRRR